MSGRNVAQPGLARLTGGQKVVSSNLIIPTIFLFSIIQSFMAGFFCVLFYPMNDRHLQQIISKTKNK